MKENENAQTKQPVILSINKLMNLYRESLTGIIPSLEQAQVSWDSFDEFEEIETISEALFNLIVKYQLEKYISEKYSSKLKLPPYGFYLKSYQNFDYIQVKMKNTDDTYVFVLIESKQNAFDTVMCDKIDQKDNIISRENEFLWDDVDFVLQINTK
jgi:hypothetical protein